MLELLATNAGANKRDLARLLGLKGSDRIVLKRMLKELENDGAISATQTRPDQPRRIGGDGHDRNNRSDDDGELLAQTLAWDSKMRRLSSM